MNEWTPTSICFPPPDLVVETKIDDGKYLRNQTKLKFSHGLWFFPDGSMYVYYTPTHWRYL